MNRADEAFPANQAARTGPSESVELAAANRIREIEILSENHGAGFGGTLDTEGYGEEKQSIVEDLSQLQRQLRAILDQVQLPGVNCRAPRRERFRAGLKRRVQ